MEINLDKQTELDAELYIKLEPGDYEENFNSELKKYQKEAAIPGFRKGKVPLGLLKKRLGSDLKKQIIPDTVNKAVQDYLEENDLKLLLNPLQTHPKDEPDWENNDSFEFRYLVGLRPEIDYDLQEYLGEVTRYKIEVSEKELDEQINKLRNMKGTTENKDSVEEEEGLSIRLKIVELDDETQEEFEGGFSTSITKQLNDLPEGLQNALAGKQVEEVLSLELASYFESSEGFATFLDVDKLTAQDLSSNFNVTIEAAYTFQQGELNEALYKEVFPDKEINSEEEFREAIKEAMESSYERESDGYLFKEIKDHFVKVYDKGLPEQFLKEWYDHVQKEQEQEEQQEDEKNEEEKYADFVNDIKWMMIIDGLAERFEVSVEDQEVKDYARAMIRNEVSRIGMGEIEDEKINEYADNYLKDRNNYFKSHFTLKEDKVFKQIKEAVEFQEKHVTYNEFQEIVNQDKSEQEEVEAVTEEDQQQSENKEDHE